MLIDTHCHINAMVKEKFDIPLEKEDFKKASNIVNQAKEWNVDCIINVGTSLIESKNCVALAKDFKKLYAVVGIHPNDLTSDWKKDLEEIKKLVKEKEKNKIVGIGEAGIDRHYPGYNLQQQKDAFKAQIELALENNLAIVVHSRDAYDETLYCIEEFAGQIERGIIHCFSEDQAFADKAIEWNFVLGFGGTVTYPKNNELRNVASKISIDSIVLETDAPFLPPQIIRGKENHPKYIKTIAEFIAELRNVPFAEIEKETTKNALRVFNI